jgi:putative Ca2+/H+ antiporter (TMEM165/GDT1 family)
MNFAIVLAVFPIVFIGELPDKTMFSSLVLSSRGKPLAVWAGAAAAFFIHVVIAVTIGVGLFAILPHTVLEIFVAVLFFAGAFFAFRESVKDQMDLIEEETQNHRRIITAAFLVTFIAEWGDLTQILTANLAAHYHSSFSVGLGAVLALWSVAAIAVVSGQGLLRVLSITTLRRVMGVVLVILGCVSLFDAFR